MLAQTIGVIAFIIGVIAFLQKNDMRFRYHMIAYCLIMGVHFTLMGASVAAIGIIINATRTFASIKTQSPKLMWAFMIFMWLIIFPNITNVFELLTLIGSSIATWALFSTQGIVLRILILLNSVCWLIHNIWVGSIGGSLIDSTFITTNILTIYRLNSSK